MDHGRTQSLRTAVSPILTDIHQDGTATVLNRGMSGSAVTGMRIAAEIEPFICLDEVLSNKEYHTNQQYQHQNQGDPCSLRDSVHFLTSPKLGKRIAKLAFCRVSAAFIKASNPQTEIMPEPPLERNGNVTPVNGTTSSDPNTLRIVCITRILAAVVPAMV